MGLIKNILITVLCVVSSLVTSAAEITFNKLSGLESFVPETVWSFTVDDDGYFWYGNNRGLYRSDGYKIENLYKNNPELNVSQVRKVFKDSKGQLWVGTRGNGLFYINDKKLYKFSGGLSKRLDYVSTIIENEGGIWLGIENGISQINDGDVVVYDFPKSWTDNSKLLVTAMVDAGEVLFISTQYQVITFNKRTHDFLNYHVTGLENVYINTLYSDQNQNIWLGSDAGVFLKSKDKELFVRFMPESINQKIRSIVATEDDWWFGTNNDGLIKVSRTTKRDLTFFKSIKKDKTSISGNSVIFMDFFDGLLFISTFYGGMDYVAVNTLKFGLQDDISCSKDQSFYDIDFFKKNMILIANEHVIKQNQSTGKCEKLVLSNTELKPNFFPNSVFIDSYGTHWITTYKGLFRINKEDDLIYPVPLSDSSLEISFMFERSQGSYFLGTANGLYNFSSDDFNLELIQIKHTTEQNIQFNSFIKGPGDSYYLATDKGVFTLHKDSAVLNKQMQTQLFDKNVLALHVNDDLDLWVGTHKSGLFKFDSAGNLKVRYDQSHGISEKTSIFNIINDKNFLWISSNQGLIQLNTSNDSVHTYHQADGLQGDLYTFGASHKTDDGKLYFGGKDGINAFYPEDIKLNNKPPTVVLTEFTRFGKPVEAGEKNDGFVLEKDINDMQELILDHKDYVLGFEFAALDFADPARNEYAYKLEGLNPDWTYVKANNRKAGYTNLAAGHYNFRVKASNKDGIWNEVGKSLSIRVLPAPWQTWWAYTLYFIGFVSLVLLYMQHKHKANIRKMKVLRAEVKKQTHEIETQKQKVESLLAHKNEMFANVSHEFRTPLTLILGPVDQLLKEPLHIDNIKSLEMVNRNANRLLTMIEQFLQLAKLTENQDVKLVPQQVHTSVETIVDSFQSLAETKQIKLSLVQNDSCAIEASENAIDTILSNLISNALKYTDTGGEVKVKSTVINQVVTIEVRDNGCGLSPTQQKDIFNRFHRLDQHLNTEGVGIGLPLVKEVAKLNKGEIEVESSMGSGSAFIVKFNCIDFMMGASSTHEEVEMVMANQLQKEAIEFKDETINDIQFIGDSKQETILVIDDNEDMLDYIGKRLKNAFHCILVNRGKTGVAVAIKHIPDIIVCDVMMPEMNGFEVCRTVRSDSRTSHIPLILLTALNDKQSRIKGWRENVDVYLTKPFDADELLLQLENIITIRKILKRKASQAITSESIAMTSGLAKLDHQFIDKLMKVIETNYNNPQILRPHLADLMAVSERQLQRKTKALVDKNPLDLLREYRLRQAVKMLKDGYQVSQTADMCGFNSVSYFSKCFNQQYGVNPKQYQSIQKKPLIIRDL